MPIQYIIGEWEFRDLVLKMQPPVFIPRPETEELVELVLQQFDCKRTMRFIEVGCGTGAISLALLKALPKVSVTQHRLVSSQQHKTITHTFDYCSISVGHGRCHRPEPAGV